MLSGRGSSIRSHNFHRFVYNTTTHAYPSLSLSHCNIEILLKGNYKIGKRLSLNEHQYIFPYRKHDEWTYFQSQRDKITLIRNVKICCWDQPWIRSTTPVWLYRVELLSQSQCLSLQHNNLLNSLNTRVILTEQKTRTVKTTTMISRGLLTRKTKLNKKMKYFRHGFTELRSLLLPGAIFKVKNILMFKSLLPYTRSQILKQTLYGVHIHYTYWIPITRV